MSHPFSREDMALDEQRRLRQYAAGRRLMRPIDQARREDGRCLDCGTAEATILTAKTGVGQFRLCQTCHEAR